MAGYIIMGRSEYGTEEIDEAKDRAEADYLVREYRMAYGSGWTIWKKRAR